jgi:hypothetical protein
MARGNSRAESENRLVGRDVKQLRRQIKSQDFSLEKAAQIPELKFLADPAFKEAFEKAYTEYADSQIGEEGVSSSDHQPDSIFIEREGKIFEVMFPEVRLSWNPRDADPDEWSHDEERFFRETGIIERSPEYLKKNGIVFAEGEKRFDGKGSYLGQPTLMDFSAPGVKVKVPWNETAEWNKIKDANRGFRQSIEKYDRVEVERTDRQWGVSGQDTAIMKYVRKDGQVERYEERIDIAQREAETRNKQLQSVKDFKRKHGVE